MGTKFKRGRLWVDPAFQSRLMLRMGFYLLLYTGLVMLLGIVFEQLGDFGDSLTRKSPEGRSLDFLGRQKYLLFAFVLALPIILYDLLRFSHRVAGPLYRCRKVMQQMAGGEPVPEFKPRKHDLMWELFQAFNTLIKEWNTRVSAGGNGHLAEGNTADRLTGAIDTSPKDDAVAVP
jgi:hypothetical protein